MIIYNHRPAKVASNADVKLEEWKYEVSKREFVLYSCVVNYKSPTHIYSYMF